MDTLQTMYPLVSTNPIDQSAWRGRERLVYERALATAVARSTPDTGAPLETRLAAAAALADVDGAIGRLSEAAGADPWLGLAVSRALHELAVLRRALT